MRYTDLEAQTDKVFLMLMDTDIIMRVLKVLLVYRVIN